MPKITQEQATKRRQQIVEAAYRCFARKGFHNATMRDIYAEAELSPGAIYHYFNSKEEIIEASFAFDYERGLPVFERSAANPDALAALDELVEFFFAGLESAAAVGADRVNIQGWGEALHNPRLLAPLHNSLRDFRDQLAQLIRRGQAAGQIDPQLEPDAVGEVVLSTYFGLYLQKALIPELDVSRYKDAAMALLHGMIVKTT
jgi:AcrR family transcriptional regulator